VKNEKPKYFNTKIQSRYADTKKIFLTAEAQRAQRKIVFINPLRSLRLCGESLFSLDLLFFILEAERIHSGVLEGRGVER
jgi:hypothetical protein